MEKWFKIIHGLNSKVKPLTINNYWSQNMHNIEIDSRYLSTEDGTSDGTQIKFLFEDNWYKIDRYGGEGLVEELISHILEISNVPSNEYVSYSAININGEPGCFSHNFLQENESFITFYRLYANINGGDLAQVTSKMEYDDAIEFVISFIKDNTKVDVRQYLANTFLLDDLILNEDRHFNNLGLIFNGENFRVAPVFDNGKSLFIGNKRYDSQKSIKDNKKIAFAKAFSGSFDLNKLYLSKFATWNLNHEAISKYLSDNYDLSQDNVYSRLYKLIER